MKIILLCHLRIIAVLACLLQVDLAAQTLEWVKQLGGVATENIRSMEVDKDGNIFLLGTFNFIADFDPSDSLYVLNSEGFEDVFIAKYDRVGNLIWANRCGSKYHERIEGGENIEVDTAGNIYLSFQTVGHNLLPYKVFFGKSNYAVSPLPSQEFTNGYVVKFDQNGLFQEFKLLTAVVSTIAADLKGDIFVICHNYDSDLLVFDGKSIDTFPMQQGVYLAKFIDFHNISWSAKIGNITYEYYNVIKIDQNNDIITSSRFSNALDLSVNYSPQKITSVNNVDHLIAKVSDSGEIMWVKQLTGVSRDVLFLDLDKNNNIVLSSDFYNRVIVDPGGTNAYLTTVGTSPTSFTLLLSTIGSTVKLKKNEVPSNFTFFDATSYKGKLYILYENKTSTFQAKVMVLDSLLNVERDMIVGQNSMYNPFELFEIFDDEVILVGSFTGEIDADPTCKEKKIISTILSEDLVLLKLKIGAKDSSRIVGIDEICLGDSVNLQFVGSALTKWSNGQYGSSTTINPPWAGKYSIWAEKYNNDSCVVRYYFDLNVKPFSVQIPKSPLYICINDTISLSTSGGENYSWSTGQTDSVILVSPVSTTIYAVTVTSSNACQKVGELQVIVNSRPAANAGIDQTICAGKQAILVATGGQTYRWSNNSNQASTTVSPSTTTTYTVTATDSNGCKSADQVVVVVNPLPIADAGPDQTICSGDTVFLEANGGVAYFWNNSNTTKSLIANPLLSTTFIVTVTDGNGCTASDGVNIKVNPKPDVDLLGIDTLKLKVGQFVILYAGKGEKFLWSTGDTTNTIVIDQNSSWYCVTVTNTFGCRGNDCLFVQFPPNATSDLDKGAVTIYPNPSNDFITIDVHNSTSPKYDLRLFNSAGQLEYQLSNITTSSQQIEVAQLPPGQYLAHMVFDGYTVVDKVLILN